MKHEPLKNKRIDMIYEDRRGIFCGLSIISDDNGEFFKFDDVKSAVDGLKKELKYKYKTDFISYDMIIQLVDKWFEDVIK